MANVQQWSWRGFCVAASLVLTAFLVYTAVVELGHPYSQKHTADLRGLTSPRGVQAALISQGAATLLAALPMMAVRRRRRHQPGEAAGPAADKAREVAPLGGWRRGLLLAATALCAPGSAYWAAALTRAVRRYGWEGGLRWELLMLCGPPLGACMLGLHVAAMLADTAREIERLRSYRYHYKKL